MVCQEQLTLCILTKRVREPNLARKKNRKHITH